MKILLIHRYFWPDSPPYATMLLSIGKQLVKDGHEVVVLTSFPSYKLSSFELTNKKFEIYEGMVIKRIKLFDELDRNSIFKLFNMFYFPIRIFTHIVTNRSFDIVMCSTAPPVVTGFFSALGSKLINAKFLYHCMDIHPEIGRISGEFKNPLLFKFLNKLDQWSCKNSEKVIVLSEDMKNSLLIRNPIFNKFFSQKIETINNFSLSESIEDDRAQEITLDKQFKKKNGKFRILFAGNIGRFQMLEAFIDSMDLLTDLPEVELVFLGEGKALKSLMERSKKKRGKNILFFPHQKISIARQIMADADLGIVSLLPEIYRYALPSKTTTYLAEGCPLLVTVEKESGLVDFITKYKIGVTATPGDPESIAKAIRSFIENDQLTHGITSRCKQVALDEYSETKILSKWSKLIHELSEPKICTVKS